MRYFIVLILFVSAFISENAQAQSKFYERGLAEIIPDGQKTGKNLALHRSLPVGKKIGVRNPVNGRVITIEIVGRLPDTGANEKIILKVSEAAYRQLLASGRRFAVELFDAPQASKITHEVTKGETLYSIAKKYKVSVDEVKEWNNLEDNTISEGQKLTIVRKAGN
ncbi:MAG: LysM peptidoglycan-binding domain-containing protein [Microscillaceae bacterium]|nr:LysM peptidoglycan-binding domain-containing protein [Microscillaceae bacterium]